MNKEDIFLPKKLAAELPGIACKVLKIYAEETANMTARLDFDFMELQGERTKVVENNNPFIDIIKSMTVYTGDDEDIISANSIKEELKKDGVHDVYLGKTFHVSRDIDDAINHVHKVKIDKVRRRYGQVYVGLQWKDDYDQMPKQSLSNYRKEVDNLRKRLKNAEYQLRKAEELGIID